ncbi:protein kinase domain-containing protein [Planctomyces sp. SH-PL62]|uniref:protein kinase domain-containing protein n=1 Tax=Planctomyces sp. SH-PL62 TaxID=1636152 RepID=UPI00078EF2FE|nr:protein kinase [Planctomyces sp. SH-PL62]AMV37192.1 Serine/threonine-protein kinase PknB [Planctomyces sp. SH-PL62]
MSGDRSNEREDEVLYGAWEIDSVRSLDSLRPSLGGVRGPHAKVPSRPSRSNGAGEVPGEVAAPNGGTGGGGLSQTCVHLEGIGSASEAGSASGAGHCPVSLEQLRLGDEVGGFRLIAELGRGAFARVFLAEEASLGGRRVALKISAAEGDEPQILARLQHAHIVPVHSVRDDPRTGLRLLCMPFLGGANLAQVMEEARAVQGANHEGRSLVEALDQLSRRFPCPVEDGYRSARRSLIRSRSHDGVSLRVDPPVGSSRKAATAGRCDRPSRRFGPLRRMLERGAEAEDSGPEGAAEEMLPSRRFLRGADVVRASVWIVARLAEGLEHAHGRGLLHRDLKPSNVLIAADGTPMLLDFNLAVESEVVESADESVARATVGGTLPYMAPEHLDALDPEGTTSPDAVDERSDLYSLGLILFEMIADAPAFEPVPTGGARCGCCAG